MGEQQPICWKCGSPMERKCFMSGAPPIWRCKPCEYKEQDEMRKKYYPAPPTMPSEIRPIFKPVEKMSDAELDAELRSYGIDPEQLCRNMLARLLKKKAEGFDTPLLNEMIRQFSEANQ